MRKFWLALAALLALVLGFTVAVPGPLSVKWGAATPAFATPYVWVSYHFQYYPDGTLYGAKYQWFDTSTPGYNGASASKRAVLGCTNGATYYSTYHMTYATVYMYCPYGYHVTNAGTQDG